MDNGADKHNNGDTEEMTNSWYSQYYEKAGRDRNDLLTNPQVLFQTFAFEMSVIIAMRSIQVSRDDMIILDVGCGSGGSLLNMLRLGFNSNNMFGIDILKERINDAKTRFQNINFIHGNATSMDFSDSEFDIVMESTMFVQITDSELASNIAAEMMRVLKPGGYLILVDWRYSKPGGKYKAFSKKRMIGLFMEGNRAKLVKISNGALVPPVGRFLSAYLPSLYFLFCRFMPFLVGQKTTILKKE